MRRASRLLLAWLLTGCVDALPAGDRVDAGTTYLRLLRPRTGATTYARRPLLRWHRSNASVESRVEICADRACTRVLQTIDASGAQVQVPTALPTGTVFWRVRPRRGSVVASWGSPTGWFVVARGAHDDDRADSIDQRPAMQIDVDGDGRADVILPDGTIFRSEGDRFERTPYGRLLYANGRGAVGAGDLNGDGYLDVAVADTDNRPGGVVHLYDGPLPRGLASPRRQVTSPGGVVRVLGATSVWAEAPAGDVNGDGYDDLLLTTAANSLSSRVYLFAGGASGVAYEPAATFEAPISQRTHLTAPAMGDLDGDGFDEALLVAVSPGPVFPYITVPALFLYRGAPGGLETPPLGVLDNGLGALGRAGVLADVDGSGRGATVVNKGGCLRLYREPSMWSRETGGESLGCEEGNRAIGTNLESGDVDGDGRADLVASASAGFGFPDLGLSVRVYRAPTSEGASWRVTTLESVVGAEMDLRRYGLGDVDGDGVMDAITFVETPSGVRAFVHRGGAEGLSAVGAPVAR